MAQVAKEHDDHDTACLRLSFAVFGRVAAAGVLVVGVNACSSSSAATRTSASTPGSSASAPVVTAGAAPGLQQQYESVSKAVLPSIVEITVTNSGRAALGIEASGVTDQSGTGVGTGVVSVTQGGAAANAGLQAGDVIAEVHDVTVTSAQQLTSVLANLKAGQTVPVVVQRNGSSKTFQVTLGQLPGSA